MVDGTDELEKVVRNVKLQWQNLHSEFPEGERTSAAYLAGFHRIQSWDQVQSSAALRVPLAGRFADAAVDAKTSVRLLELLLERQIRMEQKVTRLHNLATVGFGILVGFAVYQLLTG